MAHFRQRSLARLELHGTDRSSPRPYIAEKLVWQPLASMMAQCMVGNGTTIFYRCGQVADRGERYGPGHRPFAEERRPIGSRPRAVPAPKETVGEPIQEQSVKSFYKIICKSPPKMPVHICCSFQCSTSYFLLINKVFGVYWAMNISPCCRFDHHAPCPAMQNQGRVEISSFLFAHTFSATGTLRPGIIGRIYRTRYARCQ